METKKITYFIVEIGGADFYFEKLQDASDFFAKLASTNAEKIGRLGYGKDSYNYRDGKHMPTMKQDVLEVYETEKSARFAKHQQEVETQES